MGLFIKKLRPVSCGGNCYFIMDESSRQAALIDAAADSETVLAELAAQSAELKYILLTHGHFDHILTVDDVRQATGCKVAIHEGDADFLTDSEKNAFLHFFMQDITFEPADVILQDGDKIKLGESELGVLHTPGHTEGSVCFTYGNKMFSGDTLFNGSIGRTDLLGGDFATIKASLDMLMSLADYEILPGHGGRSTLSAEKANNPFITGIMD